MTRVVVNSGICGEVVTVEVVKVDRQRVRIEVTSECEMVAKMGESLAELDCRDVLKPPVDSEVYKVASEHGLHAACPVPMAVLKAIEVESGLALPRPVLVHFETTEPG
jgi:hypothetical protein